jgi:hypothetical protein
LRALLVRKIAEHGKKCGICGEPSTDCTDIVPDHIVPKGMGSANRDDHPDNIQATHRLSPSREYFSKIIFRTSTSGTSFVINVAAVEYMFKLLRPGHNSRDFSSKCLHFPKP